MPMTSKEMVKFLLKNGFIEVSGGKGSHRKFQNPATGKPPRFLITART